MLVDWLVLVDQSESWIYFEARNEIKIRNELGTTVYYSAPITDSDYYYLLLEYSLWFLNRH